MAHLQHLHRILKDGIVCGGCPSIVALPRLLVLLLVLWLRLLLRLLLLLLQLGRYRLSRSAIQHVEAILMLLREKKIVDGEGPGEMRLKSRKADTLRDARPTKTTVLPPAMRDAAFADGEQKTSHSLACDHSPWPESPFCASRTAAPQRSGTLGEDKGGLELHARRVESLLLLP